VEETSRRVAGLPFPLSLSPPCSAVVSSNPASRHDNPVRFRSPGLGCRVLGCVLPFLLVLVGKADQVAALTPVADTSLLESNHDNNLGGLSSIPAGTTQQGRSRALFRFDLTTIPAGAMVTAAELGVVAVNQNSQHQSSIFALNRLLRNWGEGSGSTNNFGDPATTNAATWNNRFHPATPWSAPGGGSGLDYAAPASATTFIDTLTNYTFGSTTSMVADVQSWVGNPDTNFGWILISQSEATQFTVRRFASREDAVRSPVLTVHYVLPPVISSPLISGKQIRFSFLADSNRTWTVESRTSMVEGSWEVLTNIPAQPAAATIQVSDLITTKSAFYRVRSP